MASSIRRRASGSSPWLIGTVSVVSVILVGVAAYRMSGSHVATASALAIVAWVGVAYLSPRPVLFSYALLAALAIVLERPGLRWSIPLIVWVWASIHGSFVVGIGLVVLHRLARKRPVGRDLAALVLVASLTAHGLGIWQTLLRFVQNRAALDLITEWAPPKLTNPDLLPYLAVVGLLMWGSSTGAVTRRDLIVVIPFVLFGLTAARSLFPALIVLAPYTAQTIGRSSGVRSGSGGVHWAVNAAAAVVIVWLPFLITPAWEGLSDTRFPIEEAAALEPGRVFHDDVVGGYLIYAHPEVQVFVDDRAELYGAEHFSDVVATRNARPRWQDVFETYEIDQALLSREDGLVSVLELSGWERRAEGESYVVLAVDP